MKLLEKDQLPIDYSCPMYDKIETWCMGKMKTLLTIYSILSCTNYLAAHMTVNYIIP